MSRVQLFGIYTQLFNIFIILVLLVMGIYYPRFSKGMSGRLVRKIKLVWMAVFIILLVGFKLATPFMGDGVYVIVAIASLFLVKNLMEMMKLRS
jgi:hypothetical protein